MTRLQSVAFSTLMKNRTDQFTKRESELMEAVYVLGKASAQQIESELDSPPSNAAVRALLSKLVEKGHLEYKKEGRQFIYRPTVAPDEAGKRVLRNAVATFFDGSLSQAVAGFLSNKETEISKEELQALEELVAEAKRKEV